MVQILGSFGPRSHLEFPTKTISFSRSQDTDLPVDTETHHQLLSHLHFASHHRKAWFELLVWSLYSRHQSYWSCLEYPLHVYHPLLAHLELPPHLLDLHIVTPHQNLGYVVPVIGQDHLHLDLLFPRCFCPVVHSPGTSIKNRQTVTTPVS